MWKTTLIRDGHGLWQMMYIKPRAIKNSMFSFSCQNICEHNLHRPHATCLWCRGRRVYMKQLPSKIRVLPYLLLIHEDRKYERIKRFLLKRVLTIAEMLAN